MSERKAVVAVKALALVVFWAQFVSQIGQALKNLTQPAAQSPRAPNVDARIAKADACPEQAKRNVVFVGCDGIYD